MTEPLTTIEHDVSGLDGFMLDTDKLMASELVALASGEEFKAAVCLWCRAWKQVPAGSLPNDERVLAAFSGAGKTWPKVREVALRGFILCSDGRLYHKTLCDDVRRAALAKAKRKERTKAATEARNVHRYVDRYVEQSDDVTKSHRRDGTIKEEKGTLSSSQKEQGVDEKLPRSVSRGTPYPDNFQPLPNIFEDARNRGLTDSEISDELDAMKVWASNAGSKGFKKDWHGFTRIWLRKRAAEKKEKSNGKASNGHKPNSIAGGFDVIDAAVAQLRQRESGIRDGNGEADAESIPRLLKIAS